MDLHPLIETIFEQSRDEQRIDALALVLGLGLGLHDVETNASETEEENGIELTTGIERGTNLPNEVLGTELERGTKRGRGRGGLGDIGIGIGRGEGMIGGEVGVGVEVGVEVGVRRGEQRTRGGGSTSSFFLMRVKKNKIKVLYFGCTLLLF